MKKNLKKLSSLALAFALVFSLSASAFAADVSADKAKEVALAKAGVAAEDVLNLRAEVDYDDGLKFYDVSFLVPQADGSYLEYEVEVGAANGKVYDYDVDREGRAKAKAEPKAEAKPKAAVKVESGKDVGLADKDGEDAWGINSTAAKRGLADRFMSEYMHFLLPRKTVSMEVDTTLSQLTSLSWFKQLRISDTVGRLKSRAYTVTNSGVSDRRLER